MLVYFLVGRFSFLLGGSCWCVEFCCLVFGFLFCFLG